LFVLLQLLKNKAKKKQPSETKKNSRIILYFFSRWI